MRQGAYDHTRQVLVIPTMALARVKKNTPLNPHFHLQYSCAVFSKFFTSIPLLKPLSSSGNPDLDVVEAQILSLCKKPNLQVRDAFSLFEESADAGLVPSAPTCNFLLRTLAKNKEYDLALRVYKGMTRVGVAPQYMALSGLVECLVHFRAPQLAVAAVGLMLKHGYKLNVYVANVILNGYCCNGFGGKAEEFLGEMERNTLAPDKVSFNTLIKGFCRERNLAAALAVKTRMECSSSSPNLVTYAILISAQFTEGQVDGAEALLEEMALKGLEPDSTLYGTLVNGYCNHGDVDRAKEVFNEILSKGISPGRITYASLMQGLCQKGKLGEAKSLFNDMIKSGIQPDVVMFTGMISRLFEIGKADKAMELFSFMLDKGEDPNTTTYNVLINGLCKAGLLDDAFRILEMMVEKDKKPNIVTYNTLLKGLCNLGKGDVATKLFDMMISDNCVEPDSWTIGTFVGWLCGEGDLRRAEKIVRGMAALGKLADVAPFSLLVGAYLKGGNAKKGMSMWKEFIDMGLVPDAKAHSVVLDGLCKCDLLSIAKGYFTKLRICGSSPTRFHYNILMAALCRESSLDQARALFEDMISVSCGPDVVSFNIMIESAVRSGNLQSLNELLADMQQRGLHPNALTFAILVNKFSKLGMMEEAKSVYERMKTIGLQPDAFVYDSLLKGFKADGNTEETINLLHKMADTCVHLDPRLTSTILMCLCELPGGDEVAKLLPSFTQEKLRESNTTCDELLMKLQNVFLMPQPSPQNCEFKLY